MERIKMLTRLYERGVVAIIRTNSTELAIKIVDAVKEGGIDVAEITMSVPGALDIIKKVSEHYSNDEMCIGAGTVLDTETARACILAGAKFIVSPNFNAEVVRMCNRYRIGVIPGVMTVQDTIDALETGAEILKFFPANAFGPNILKQFRAPLPQANYVITAGVEVSNINDWIKAGAFAVSISSILTKYAKEGRYDLVTEECRKYIAEVKKARLGN
jgi:2-dehydro-3-deoxyphosphogluconate aldolase/(4S)-4-hydroxy-2-oxoglutarate aldolase